MDSLYSHGAWAAVRGLTFPLLADFHPKGQVAPQYGVMRDSDGFSERALYIIDYRDMEYDPEAARRVQWWTGGNASHPTVQILVEPSLDEIDWVLSRHGLM